MEVRIQNIHFNATEALHDFIEKKLLKLSKMNESLGKADVVLSVVKPETNNNKSTSVHLTGPGVDFHVEKTCDTFEEGIDLCVEVLKRHLEKIKDRKSTK